MQHCCHFYRSIAFTVWPLYESPFSIVQICLPNGILIGSDVFAWLTVVTITQRYRDRIRYVKTSVAINHIFPVFLLVI